jgi:hypothetical protein
MRVRRRGFFTSDATVGGLECWRGDASIVGARRR